MDSISPPIRFALPVPFTSPVLDFNAGGSARLSYGRPSFAAAQVMPPPLGLYKKNLNNSYSYSSQLDRSISAASNSNHSSSAHTPQVDVTGNIADAELSNPSSDGLAVLSWTSPESYTEASDGTVTLRVDPARISEPSGLFPPAYDTVCRPTQPIIYTFSPLSFNSMLLLPPPTAQHTRAEYHISVNLNCFIPSSFITTIRRGATEYGQYVGEFEMGISNQPDTLCIRGSRCKISDILRTSIKKWTWTSGSRHFVWEDSKSLITCYSPNHRVVYARFARAPLLTDVPARLARLEVLPAGQELFDDILMSVLITERSRLTLR